MSDASPSIKDVQKRCEAFIDSLQTPGFVIFGWKQASGGYAYTYAVRRMPKTDVAERIAWLLEDSMKRSLTKGKGVQTRSDEIQKRCIAFIEELGSPGFIAFNWRKKDGAYRTMYSTRRVPREVMLRGLVWTLGRHLRKK